MTIIISVYIVLHNYVLLQIMNIFCSYFDSHGNYYQKDTSGQIRDNWMDNLDWVKVSLSEGFSNTNL